MTSRLITPQLAEQFKLYPLYSQDGKKKDAICQCVFFIGKVRWYVLEGQPEGNDFTLFSIVVGLAAKFAKHFSPSFWGCGKHNYLFTTLSRSFV